MRVQHQKLPSQFFLITYIRQADISYQIFILSIAYQPGSAQDRNSDSSQSKKNTLILCFPLFTNSFFCHSVGRSGVNYYI